LAGDYHWSPKLNLVGFNLGPVIFILAWLIPREGPRPKGDPFSTFRAPLEVQILGLSFPTITFICDSRGANFGLKRKLSCGAQALWEQSGTEYWAQQHCLQTGVVEQNRFWGAPRLGLPPPIIVTLNRGFEPF